MADFYTPPGWLNIWGFLDQVALKEFKQTTDCAKFSEWESEFGGGCLGSYTFVHLENLEDLKKLQKTVCFPVDISLKNLRITIPKQYDLKYRIDTNISKPTILNTFSDLLFWRAIFETRNLVRDKLASSTLKAYVFHNDHYKEVPSVIWHAEEHWYRLLGDSRVTAHIPSIDAEYHTTGIVFFKKEDANNWVSSTPSDQQDIPASCGPDSDKPTPEKPLVNLCVYSTPWLAALNEAYKHYGKGELGQISKECLEGFMKAYITEKALDIASSDIPLLAKFLRLPEQKKGRAYQSNKGKN